MYSDHPKMIGSSPQIFRNIIKLVLLHRGSVDNNSVDFSFVRGVLGLAVGGPELSGSQRSEVGSSRARPDLVTERLGSAGLGPNFLIFKSLARFGPPDTPVLVPQGVPRNPAGGCRGGRLAFKLVSMWRLGVICGVVSFVCRPFVLAWVDAPRGPVLKGTRRAALVRSPTPSGGAPVLRRATREWYGRLGVRCRGQLEQHCRARSLAIVDENGATRQLLTAEEEVALSGRVGPLRREADARIALGVNATAVEVARYCGFTDVAQQGAPESSVAILGNVCVCKKTRKKTKAAEREREREREYP